MLSLTAEGSKAFDRVVKDHLIIATSNATRTFDLSDIKRKIDQVVKNNSHVSIELIAMFNTTTTLT